MLTGLLLGIATFMSMAQPPIELFDLTYALEYDAGNPQQVAAAWDHVHVVSTLQGIVNRDEPRLYINFVKAHGISIDKLWLERMSGPGAWLAGRQRVPIRDIHELIRRHQKEINGAVVYDSRVPATSNLASTIAGVEDVVAVRYDPSPDSLYTQLIIDPRGPRLKVVRKLFRDNGSPLFSGEGQIPETDLPSTGSAKCDAYLWLKTHYIDTGKVDAAYTGFYIDSFWMQNPTAANSNQHTLTNHDYFVAKRGFFFDLNVWPDETPIDDREQKPGSDLETLKALFKSAYEQAGHKRMIHVGGFTPWAYKYTTHGRAGGKNDGVPTEWMLVKILSAYNAFVDADAIGFAALANASFFMHYPLKNEYPQSWITRDDLRKRGLLTDDGRVDFDGRDFIIFYVGDYDSAAWIYQWMPKLWDHPSRGEIPLMWSVTPVAERRVPMVLDYMRATATKNDYFVAADNGAGYLNPGMLQEPREYSNLLSGLNVWAEHCVPLYRRWDLSITGFVIDGYAPGLNGKGLDCYARFSPNGIVPQVIPATLLHGRMPVLRADRDLPNDPKRAADLIIERIGIRELPFHWFRAILKSPDYYVAVTEELRARNPKVQLLDAPAFFELFRVYLETHPDAANGRIKE